MQMGMNGHVHEGEHIMYVQKGGHVCVHAWWAGGKVGMHRWEGMPAQVGMCGWAWLVGRQV